MFFRQRRKGVGNVFFSAGGLPIEGQGRLQQYLGLVIKFEGHIHTSDCHLEVGFDGGLIRQFLPHTLNRFVQYVAQQCCVASLCHCGINSGEHLLQNFLHRLASSCLRQCILLPNLRLFSLLVGVTTSQISVSTRPRLLGERPGRAAQTANQRD